MSGGDTGQVLRTGVLFKKGSGTGMGPFGRRNWKPRYFVLTPTRLRYFTFENGDLKGELDISRCEDHALEVMPADSMKTGSSASTIWRVAINTPERRFLIAAGTEMEMNDWVDTLSLAFRINKGEISAMEAQQHQEQQQLQHHHQEQAQIRQRQASLDASASAATNSSDGITNFQNFANPRRSNHHQQHGPHHHGHQQHGGGTRNSVGSFEHDPQRRTDRQVRTKRSASEQEDAYTSYNHTSQHTTPVVATTATATTTTTSNTPPRSLDRQQQEELLAQQRELKRRQHERERSERERIAAEQERARQAQVHAPPPPQQPKQPPHAPPHATVNPQRHSQYGQPNASSRPQQQQQAQQGDVEIVRRMPPPAPMESFEI